MSVAQLREGDGEGEIGGKSVTEVARGFLASLSQTAILNHRVVLKLETTCTGGIVRLNVLVLLSLHKDAGGRANTVHAGR